MRKPVYLILASLALVLIFAGCARQAPPPQNTPKKTTLSVKAPKAGKIIGLIAEKGERISKDQPLFAMADELLDKQYSQTITDLAKEEAKLQLMKNGVPEASNTNLPALKSRMETAQQKASKMNQLLAIGGISRLQAQAAQQELQQATHAYETAIRQSAATKPAGPEAIAEQEKKIKHLQQQKSQQELSQQANEVLCPETGIIKDVLVANGTSVPTNKIILTLEVTQ